MRDLSGAIVCLKRSLKFNKENIAARNLLGLVYFETGRSGGSAQRMGDQQEHERTGQCGRPVYCKTSGKQKQTGCHQPDDPEIQPGSALLQAG